MLVGNMGPPAKTIIYSLKIHPINTLIGKVSCQLEITRLNLVHTYGVCTLLGGTKRNKPQSVL